MSEINALVGENIRKFRQSRGLSQERLALRAGMNTSYLGQIERGEKSPTIVVIDKIATSLAIEIKDIFELDTRHESESNDFTDKIAYELSGRSIQEQEDIYHFVLQLLIFKDKK
ncbi:helix-turn-helix domain-containing protein [Paenibacillus sp. LS1]|uniref:helix-turn-helix domain-containing protein n=1 Tax=Paenibacillus sp. LS1 TaxID=2992120 RepID=UPI002230B29B|nr:helix-turn-helix transcriptional regulator [Paenibacillus sp. LS1]MCW3795410.1 helix-turn-helix domain-containing protein [Paenibacillus sp. LS1]